MLSDGGFPNLLGNDGLESEKLHTYRECLLKGCYTCTIRDSAGSGMWEGFYKLFVNGELEFEEVADWDRWRKRSHDFCHE